MIQTREDIFNSIAQNVAALRKLGVKKLGLFGSWARDEQKPGSDLDFIVEFENKSFDVYMDLKFLLEDLFGCKIDLVTIEAIRPEFRDSIMEEVMYVPQL
jgi:uncharacterized protein